IIFVSFELFYISTDKSFIIIIVVVFNANNEIVPFIFLKPINIFTIRFESIKITIYFYNLKIIIFLVIFNVFKGIVVIFNILTHIFVLTIYKKYNSIVKIMHVDFPIQFR